MKRSQVYSISFRPSFMVLSFMAGVSYFHENWDFLVGGLIIYLVSFAATCIQIHANVLALQEEEKKDETTFH